MVFLVGSYMVNIDGFLFGEIGGKQLPPRPFAYYKCEKPV